MLLEDNIIQAEYYLTKLSINLVTGGTVAILDKDKNNTYTHVGYHLAREHGKQDILSC